MIFKFDSDCDTTLMILADTANEAWDILENSEWVKDSDGEEKFEHVDMFAEPEYREDVIEEFKDLIEDNYSEYSVEELIETRDSILKDIDDKKHDIIASYFDY